MSNARIGQFVWHDCMCEDPVKLMEFYSQIFGWSTHEPPAGEMPYYHILLPGGRGIGGFFSPPMGPKNPAYWMVYLCVEDINAATEKALKLGATAMMPPTEIPGTGWFSVQSDPTGACFNLFQFTHEETQTPSDGLPGPGEFCWYELQSPDPEAAAKFYSELMGWDIQHMVDGPGGGEQWMIHLGEQAIGGIARPAPESKAPPFWLTFVVVPDLAAASAKTVELGGKVLYGPHEIPGYGHFSLIMDPMGGITGPFEWAAGLISG